MKLESLENDPCEFQRQNNRVQHHAPGHLEHDRARIPHHQWMPNAVAAAEVEKQRHNNQLIAEERGENSRPHDGLEFFEIKQIDG
jgi:hypothetical protein